MSELLRSQSAAAPLPTSRPGNAADASPASRMPSAPSTPGAGEVLHAFTYDNGGYGRVASVRCACGWSAFVPRSHKGRSVTLGRYAQFHLRHVGAKR